MGVLTVTPRGREKCRVSCGVRPSHRRRGGLGCESCGALRHHMRTPLAGPATPSTRSPRRRTTGPRGPRGRRRGEDVPRPRPSKEPASGSGPHRHGFLGCRPRRTVRSAGSSRPCRISAAPAWRVLSPWFAGRYRCIASGPEGPLALSHVVTGIIGARVRLRVEAKDAARTASPQRSASRAPREGG